MQIEAASVSEVIYSIKRTLESEYRDITVVGEISNLSHSSAGHYYFNLSDDESSISCALFKMDAFKNPAIRRMKDGDKVLLRGPISLYVKRGTFQIICKRIIPYGKGDLKAQFEFLKEKLRSQGIFDEEHKKKIPLYPKRIAVITALRGAALQDFLNVMRRRSLWFDINIIPSIVQGDACASSIIKAIDKAEKKADYDVIVVTRGGGSIEDLWGFNDERLVKRVFDCKTPIISAVGHQVDYTLIDYVSDLRCETPSAAAEILSQPQTELNNRLRLCSREIKSLFLEFKHSIANRLERVNPIQFLHTIQKLFHQYEKRLTNLNYFENDDPIRLNEYQQYTDDLIERAKQQMVGLIDKEKIKIEHNAHLLKSLNPKSVLSRGYSYVELTEGKVVTTKDQFDKIEKDKVLKIHFANGSGKVKKC